MSDPFLQTIEYIKLSGVEYKLLEHEPTPTSIDSANLRGTTMSQGRKAMVLRGVKTGDNIMVVLQSSREIDWKKIKEYFNEKYTFEDSNILKEKYGLIVGGIPPLGNVFNIPTYFDSSNMEENIAAFNCGVQTKSVIMDVKDLIKIVNPVIFDLSK